MFLLFRLDDLVLGSRWPKNGAVILSQLEQERWAVGEKKDVFYLWVGVGQEWGIE